MDIRRGLEMLSGPLAAGAGWLAWRNYLAIPALGPHLNTDGGHVSIVVPARNEAGRIEPLLRSLSELDYRAYEVLVVDDGSTDDTARIAAQHGARVISAGSRDEGWTGKCWACWVGAAATTGPWILFTDADTVHQPDSLARAVHLARSGSAGLLSLLTRQMCTSFWERLLLPLAYCLYFVGVPEAGNGRGGSAIANGQYMLFARQSYVRGGGHAAVRSSIIEDVALAQVYRDRGEHVVLRRAEDAVAVHMYGSLRDIWHGFGKNAFRFVAASRFGAATVIAGMAFSTALPGSRRAGRKFAVLFALAPALALVPWERRFGVPAVYALLYPFASLTFSFIGLDSLVRSAAGVGTTWKGRRY